MKKIYQNLVCLRISVLTCLLTISVLSGCGASNDELNVDVADNISVETFVPKGPHAVYAEPFSVYGKLKNGLNTLTPNAMLGVSPRSENELLLNSRTKHRVLSVKVVDNTLEIYTIVEQS